MYFAYYIYYNKPKTHTNMHMNELRKKYNACAYLQTESKKKN